MADAQKNVVSQTVDSMVDKFNTLPASQAAGAEPREMAERSPEMAETPGRSSHFFGRERSIYELLGAGTFADVLLWRRPLLSAGSLAAITTVYIVFEWLQCHVLSLLSKGSLVALTAVFVWSNVASFVKKAPADVPAPHISEERAVRIGRALHDEVNVFLHKLHDVVRGKDIKLFLEVEVALWILAYVGKWADFLTTVYVGLFLLLTVPALYERHEDKVEDTLKQGYKQTQHLHDKLHDRVATKIPQLSQTGQQPDA